MKLFVGNLPFTFKDHDLEELFTPYGTVKSAKLIVDHATGRSRGFGFVEMGSKDEGLKAIEELDKKVIGNGPIVVNEARPPQKREGGAGGDRNGGRGAPSPFKKNFR